MDPLSIIASTIAIADAVGYGLEKLRDLYEANSEVCALINEVTDLKLVLLEARRSIEERKSYPQQYQGSIEKIANLLLPANDKLEELEKIVSDELTASRTLRTRIAWMRHKSKVNKILLALKEVRMNLPTIWGAANLSDLSRIQLQLDEFTVLQANHIKQLDDHGKALELISQGFDRFAGPSSSSIGTIESSSFTLTNGDSRNQLICSNHDDEVIRRHQILREHSSDGCDQPTQYSTLRVRASYFRRTRCSEWCSCSCHKPYTMKTPESLHYLLGSLFVGYSGILGRRRKCDERTCQRQSIPTVRFSYYFPTWFLARVFQITLAMSYDKGPELVLNCPRVVPDDSPIIFQAVQGNLERIQYLFQKGLASPWDVALSNGRTALHYAVNYGHRELSQYLIDTGANPNVEDKNQATSVTLAWERIFGMHTNATRYADRWRCMFDSEEYLESRTFPVLHKIVLGLVGANLRTQLQASTLSIDDVDADGRTALSWAAGKGDLEAVRTLLEFGANPNIRSRRSQTALSWAAQSPSEHRCEIVKALLDHGVDPNWHDHQRRVPLINGAADKDESPFIKLMVDAGADVNWRDCHKRTALGYCAKMNRPENTRYLLQRGADASIADHWGYTPLVEAVYQNHHDVLRILLYTHVRISNERTANGMTVLHIAALYGDELTLRILASADVRQLSPHDITRDGRTAGELFVQRENVDDPLRGAFEDLLDSILDEEFEDAKDFI